MSKILAQFFKNKKIIVIIFLFLSVGGVLIPQISYADWNPVCWQWLWGKPTAGTFHGNYCYYSSENNGVVLDTLNDAAKWTFSGVVLAVATIIIGVFGSLATLASTLFSTILGLQGSSNTMCYTCFANPAIASGWPMVRDLANMFVVLGFVVIGIATTLRIQDYQAKKLLPKLIIVAILINFSLLMCGLIIDASNIAMKNFTNGGGYLSTTVTENVANQTSAIWSNWDMNKASDTIGTAVGIAFYDIILFVVFMLFFFLFLFRYIVLWILVILSPLAFACYVFPFTKKYFEMWWSNFLGWCIIGIPAGLFLWISDKIASNFSTNSAGQPVDMSILGYLVPSFFLIAGFLISLQTSAMGAKSVIGFAKKTGNFATGAVAGGGKGLLSASGLKGLAQRAGASAKDRATSAGERFGLVSKGTTASNKAGRLSESKKRLENIQDNKELAKIAEKRPMTQQQRQDQAVAAEILAERKAFGVVDPNKRDSVAARAVASGVKKDVFTKGRPETFSGSTDAEAIEKATHDEAKRYMALTPGTSMDAALKTLKSTGWKPGAAEIKNAKLGLEKRKITENALGLAPINDKDATNKWLEDQQKFFMGMGDTREEAIAKTQKLKPNAGMIAEGKENLAQDRIQKKFEKLGRAEIKELPKEAITSTDFIEHVQANRINQAARDMSSDQITNIKTHIPYLVAEMKKAKTADPKRYKELKEKLDAIGIL